MDKEFWRDNWPLVVFGSMGLLLTTGIISHLTGQPLLPQVNWQALVAPYLPGAIAIIKGLLLSAGFTAIAIALCFVLLPLRDRLIEKQQLRAEEQRRKMLHVPVNDYRTGNIDPSMPLKLRHLQKDHQLLYSRVSAICDKYLGGKRPATIHGLLDELEFVIAQLQEQSAVPAQAAPSGPNWRAIAGLVEWARGEQKPRYRATRDAFRAAGVSIPEVDAKTGGDFWKWQLEMAMESDPSPAAPIVSVVGDSTLADADSATDNATDDENEPTDAPPVGEGRSDKVARFIIPRLARKRKAQRDEL